MVFPWQQSQWQHLLRCKEDGQLPHALLFAGISGLGKVSFTQAFLRALLCERDCLTSDQLCHACRLLAGQCHPNVLWLAPEGQAIKIDQVRNACDFVQQSSLAGGYHILVIDPADKMNNNAANALLKTLEEPPPHALLILISHLQGQLPATVLSRCQRIFFTKPTKTEALAWLQMQIDASIEQCELALNLANGAPLLAQKQIQEDIFSIRASIYQALTTQVNAKDIANLQQLEILTVLDFLLSWMIDLIALQLQKTTLVNTDYAAQLQALSTQSQLNRNIAFLTHLQQLRTQHCLGFNLNKQLMLENIFLQWSACQQ